MNQVEWKSEERMREKWSKSKDKTSEKCRETTIYENRENEKRVKRKSRNKVERQYN